MIFYYNYDSSYNWSRKSERVGDHIKLKIFRIKRTLQVNTNHSKNQGSFKLRVMMVVLVLYYNSYSLLWHNFSFNPLSTFCLKKILSKVPMRVIDCNDQVLCHPCNTSLAHI